MIGPLFVLVIVVTYLLLAKLPKHLKVRMRMRRTARRQAKQYELNRKAKQRARVKADKKSKRPTARDMLWRFSMFRPLITAPEPYAIRDKVSRRKYPPQPTNHERGDQYQDELDDMLDDIGTQPQPQTVDQTDTLHAQLNTIADAISAHRERERSRLYWARLFGRVAWRVEA